MEVTHRTRRDWIWKGNVIYGVTHHQLCQFLSHSNSDMIITRNDIPEHPEISNVYKDPWHLHFSSDHSYIYSFPNGSFPSRFHVQLEGLDSGNSLVLGFCTPLNIQPDKEINDSTKQMIFTHSLTIKQMLSVKAYRYSL